MNKPRLKCFALVALTAVQACGGGSAPTGVVGGNDTLPSAPAVATVVVSPATHTLRVTFEVQLSASPRDANGNTLARTVTWTSVDDRIARVSAAGLVTAVGPGTTFIRAESNGRFGSAQIAVPGPVATVTVTPVGNVLRAGTEQQYTATLHDAAGNVLTDRVVVWSSMNVAVAAVDSRTGLVSASSPGSTLISAISESKTGGTSLTVTPR
jgi:uncharacterized protein YjdB